VDAHGRVTVQFHWDREGKGDDKSSCWVRVSQGWGGAGWGSVFLPRVGQEVVVEFLEGDPDRPLITGRVYNGENPHPFSLPAEKTRSGIRTQSSPGGGGHNEVMLDDAAGTQMFGIRAQKDMNTHVGDNQTESVGVNEDVSVGANQTATIGDDQTIEIGGRKVEHVSGDEAITVTGNQNITIGEGQHILIGGDKTETIQGNSTTNVGAVELLLVNKSLKLDVGGDSSQQVGAATMALIKGKHEVKSADYESSVTAAEITMVTGNCSTEAAEGISEIVGGVEFLKVGGDYSVKANQITLVGAVITLDGGGSQIKLGGGPVKVKSSKIAMKATTIVKKASSIKQN
jgi:type VI secretion system secreted protein VgrG